MKNRTKEDNLKTRAEQQLSKKELKKQRREMRLAEKDKKELLKYGVTRSEVINKLPKAKKGEKGVVRTFLSYFYRYWWVWPLFVLFVAGNVVIGYYSAYVIQSLTDFAYAAAWEQVFYYIIILLVITLVGYLISYLCSLGISYIRYKGTENIRTDLSRRVLNTESSAYRTLSSGEIISRITNEPNNLANQSAGILYSVQEIITQFSFVFYFLMLDWRLGLVMLAFLIIDFVCLKFYLRYRKIVNKRAKILNDKHTSYVGEFVRGSDDVKGLNIKKEANKKTQEITRNRFNSAFFGSLGMESRSTIMSSLNFLLSTLFFLFGVYLIMIGEISFGAISILILYRSKPQYISQMLNNLFSIIQDINISCERMYEIYTDKYPQEKFGDKTLDNFGGKVEFKNVWFKYDDKYILKNLSFEIEPKTSVGIVGKSGQGKSTILSLIPRLNDCTKGKVLLDGVDNKTLTEDALRRSVCLVSQSPYIFNTSIRENLLYAKEDATEEEIIDALKKAKLFDFVMSRPNKLETLVGEGGVVLSGGQKQRLAIARAFLKNSKLLLLDEATSALDNENQNEIKNSLDALKGVCTSVIVAHRLSTIVDCDVIYVLENGKITAKGKHKELLKTCASYRKLYEKEEQASREEG